MPTTFTRRELLTSVAAGLTATNLLAGQTVATAPSVEKPPQFRFCLNTSTIRGQKKPIEEEVTIAAKAGYDGIEPWMGELRSYIKRGGKQSDLKKRIADAGLTVESAIGFARWIVDDDTQRARGLDDAKRDMELVRQIGGTRIAAPPAGATRQSNLDLFKAAARYRELLTIGRKIGVVPQLEVWGFSKTLSRLGEALLVATESGHPDACLLPDVYHIYKGGSAFAGLKLISGKAMHVFHLNDYPAEPLREKISDADRIYPGDGVAPLQEIISILVQTGFRGALSLELFNRSYWKQDPLTVARTGLRKMQQVVEQATGER